MRKVAADIFTKDKIISFVVNEALGRFVGFIIGMWSTSLFSYYVYEKKSFKNLFGMAPRKKVLVSTAPEWLQLTISIVIGFIVLELINYFFKHKIYVTVWEYFTENKNKSEGEASGS
jgi:hypothetical protein